jgi:O-methyltransferase involved in polyketide biosynthesis
MTDNETCGVATNLGSTAVAVAAQRAAETARDHPLIRDGFAALLVAGVGEPGWQTIGTR